MKANLPLEERTTNTPAVASMLGLAEQVGGHRRFGSAEETTITSLGRPAGRWQHRAPTWLGPVTQLLPGP